MSRYFSVSPGGLKVEADNLNELGSNLDRLYNQVYNVKNELRFDYSRYSGVLSALDTCTLNIRKNQTALFNYSSVCRRSALYYERVEESIIYNMDDSLMGFFVSTWRKLTDRILYWGFPGSPEYHTGALPFPTISVGGIATGLGIYSAFPYNDSSAGKLSISGYGDKYSNHTEVFGMDVGEDAEYHVGHLTNKSKSNAKWDLDKGDAGAEFSNKTKFSLVDGKYKANIGYLQTEVEGAVGNAAVTGGIGATLFSDGKFSPNVYAKAKAEANVAEGSITDTFGTDDYNVHAGAEGTFMGAEAEAKASIGRIVDDQTGETKWGAEVKAGAEAYMAQGEVSGGFTLFGIEFDATVEGKLGGGGAKAGGEVSTSAIEGEIGLGLLAGLGIKVKVDWSKAKWPWQK